MNQLVKSMLTTSVFCWGLANVNLGIQKRPECPIKREKGNKNNFYRNHDYTQFWFSEENKTTVCLYGPYEDPEVMLEHFEMYLDLKADYSYPGAKWTKHARDTTVFDGFSIPYYLENTQTGLNFLRSNWVKR